MRQPVGLMQTLNASLSRRVTLTETLNVKMFDEIDTTTLSLCERYDDPSGRPMLRNPTLGLKLGQPAALGTKSASRDIFFHIPISHV